MGCDSTTTSSVLPGSLRSPSYSPQAAQTKPSSLGVEEIVASAAMPGAPKISPGWFSSLVQDNLRECLAAGGGSATNKPTAGQDTGSGTCLQSAGECRAGNVELYNHAHRRSCRRISIRQMHLHLQSQPLPVVKVCQKFQCKMAEQLEEKPAFETVSWALLLKSLLSLLCLSNSERILFTFEISCLPV